MRLPLLLPVLLILSICLNGITAQEPVTDIDLLTGNKLWIEGHYDSAFVFYEKSKATAIEQGDEELQCYALTFSGKYFSRKGQVPEATQALNAAVSLADTSHPAVLIALRELANLNAMQGDFEQGISDVKKLLPRIESLPARLDSVKAMMYNTYGTFHLYIDDLEGGLKYCSKALEIRERILPENHPYLAFGENAIGTIYVWQGDYEKALPRLENSLSIFESNFGPSHPQALKVKTNIAVIYTDIGESRKALDLYKECLPHLESMHPRGGIITLLNMGSAYMTMGDLEESLNTFSIAESWVQENPEIMAEALAYIEGERALIYVGMEEHEKALMHIQNAIQEKTRLFGNDAEQLGKVFLRKGVILSDMDRFDESEDAFQTAIGYLKAYAPPKDVNLGHAYEYYGEMLIHSGQNRKARRQLKQALHAYSLTEVVWNKADAYAYIADSWTLEKQYDSARVALVLAMKEIASDDAFTMHPDASIMQYWQAPPLKNVLESMGEANKGFYQETGETKHLEAALACFEYVIAISDSQRHYYEVAAYRELSAKKLLKEYNVALNLSLDLYQQTGEQDYAFRAFALAEKSKAANLREHIRSQYALAYAGISKDRLEQERNYRQQLAELSDPEAEEDYYEKKRILNLEYREFLKLLERDYPKYFQLKYATKSLSEKGLFEALNKNEALYSYFWGENNVFVFRLFDNTIQAHFIPIKKSDFVDQLTNWGAFLTDPELAPSSIQQAAISLTQLRDLLLPDYSSEIESLIIIPDGQLGYLPFETLLTQSPSDNTFNSWPWLWKSSTTSYAYAAELWLQDRSVRDLESPASYLGFAPDFESDNLQSTRMMLGALQYNQTEVLEVAKLMKGKALTGNLANEKTLKNIEGKEHILHFATHAIADDESQLRSRLYLSQSEDSLEDGILHAYELYGLNLQSPLTVLSACQTGRGPLLKGEGIISLARAFQYAGSKRVLTTLWHTDDKASADFSTLFFESLAGGSSSEHALKAARQSYLKQSDSYHAHPYFWAAFIMIGDKGKIPLAQSNAWWILALGLGLAGLISILITKQSSNQAIK